METFRSVYWRDGDLWPGYLEKFADYMIQAEILEEWQEQLKDLHRDLPGGEIPGVRRTARLQVS